MSCGGKHLHIATLMRKYTRGLSTSTRPDLLVPAAETVLTDGRTDVKKKACFLEKSPFGSDGSKLDGYFRTLDAFFRTFGRRPDGPQQKKLRLKKKGLCMFALYGQIFQRQVVTKIEQFTRVSATEC